MKPPVALWRTRISVEWIGRRIVEGSQFSMIPTATSEPLVAGGEWERKKENFRSFSGFSCCASNSRCRARMRASELMAASGRETPIPRLCLG
jgi:hypothetical protein